MKVAKCVFLNFIKFTISIAVAYVLCTALISFNTRVEFVEVLMGNNQDVSILENALNNLTSEIPIAGKIVGYFFSIKSTPTINPSTGFEEFLSFVVFIPIISLILTPIFTMVSGYIHHSKKLNWCDLMCSGIDIVFNVFSLSLLALISVAATSSFVTILKNWVRELAPSVSVYNILLLILGIAFLGIYCGIQYARKKNVAKFIVSVVIDFTLSLIIITIAYTIGIAAMGAGAILPQSEITGMSLLLFALLFGLIFMLHLKQKSK